LAIILAVLLSVNVVLLENQPTLGFVNCSPALFRRLPTGRTTISISKISYDDSVGRVLGFIEVFQDSRVASPRQSTVAVLPDVGGSCPKMKYTVETLGHQLSSTAEADFKTQGLEGHFAFTATDIGGIVLVGSNSLEGGLQTKFTYDSLLRRRQLTQQAFTYAGQRYKVIYSSVTFDEFGRLSGYKATLNLVASK
jgi:hypothetical protein